MELPLLMWYVAYTISVLHNYHTQLDLSLQCNLGDVKQVNSTTKWEKEIRFTFLDYEE